MGKTESALEFTRRMAEDGLQGNLYGLRVSIEARDTAFRADERQKAAGNWEAFARKIWGSNRVMDVEQFVLEGKAAIMAEPEEGKS